MQRVTPDFHFSLHSFYTRAEAEDVSKSKDRLEALLFAETLQETLFPNANPGKGVNWRLLNLMPQVSAPFSGALRHLFTCPRLVCYIKDNVVVQPPTQKNICAKNILAKYIPKRICARSAGRRRGAGSGRSAGRRDLPLAECERIMLE